MALEEVVANKLKCLIQRRHSHDLFDLVYIRRSSTALSSWIAAWSLRTFLNKTIFSANPGAAKGILLGIPMTFFGGVWEKYIRCPKSTRFGFDRAVEGFKDSIERLFDGVSSGGWGEQLYFGGEHRHMILEAGADTATLNAHCDIATYFIDRRQEVIGILGMTQSGLGLFAYPDCHELSGRMPEIPSRKSFSGRKHQRKDAQPYRPAGNVQRPQRSLLCAWAHFQGLVQRPQKFGEIRNLVAHHHLRLSFDDKDIAKKCAELSVVPLFDLVPEDRSPRTRFKISVSVLAGWLLITALQIKQKSNLPMSPSSKGSCQPGSCCLRASVRALSTSPLIYTSQPVTLLSGIFRIRWTPTA